MPMEPELDVHTGDSRMRYYLRGILERWPALYRPNYEDSLADYGSDALTEGLGLFDGSGPGRGNRYGPGAHARADGRSLRQVNPNGCLLMAITQVQGDPGAWRPVQSALTAAAPVASTGPGIPCQSK